MNCFLIEITKDNGEAYRANYGDHSPGMKGGRGGHQQQMSGGRNPQQQRGGDYYQSGPGGRGQQDGYYDQQQQQGGRRPGQTMRGRGVGQQQQQTRIFVALFDYDPPTMSPNPDACDEELPFREGQLIKVCYSI